MVRNGAARERGRRRSAYEAPKGWVAPGPVSGGAESKRRRCPRSRARQSRVTLLARRCSLEGVAGLAPGAHPAIECQRAGVAHGAQRRCRQRRDLAELAAGEDARRRVGDRKSTRLNSSHSQISYAVFCLKKKKKKHKVHETRR